MKIEEAFDPKASEDRALQFLEPEEYQAIQQQALEMIAKSELDPAPEALEVIGGLITIAFLSGVSWMSDSGINIQGGDIAVPAPEAFSFDGEYFHVPLRPQQVGGLLQILLAGDEDG